MSCFALLCGRVHARRQVCDIFISRAIVSPAALLCPSRPGKRTTRNADGANPASAFSALLDDNSPAASTGVNPCTAYVRVRALSRMCARAHISLHMPKTCSCVTVAAVQFVAFSTRADTCTTHIPATVIHLRPALSMAECVPADGRHPMRGLGHARRPSLSVIALATFHSRAMP